MSTAQTAVVTPPTPSENPAAAIASASGNPAPAPSGDRPAWLPEKFATPEDFAKSYSELEAKFTQSNQTPKDQPADPVDPADKTADAGKTAEAAAAAGFDLDPFTKEFEDTGDISAESRAKIVEGLSKLFGDKTEQIVANYIEGTKAQSAAAEAQTAKLFDVVGGKDQFAKMAEWAQKNWSQARIKAFDAATQAGDFDVASDALKNLRTAYEGATGRPAALVTGDNRTVAQDVFQNSPQVTKAMGDPRYQNDPAYRQQVIDKLLRSKVF